MEEQSLIESKILFKSYLIELLKLGELIRRLDKMETLKSV